MSEGKDSERVRDGIRALLVDDNPGDVRLIQELIREDDARLVSLEVRETLEAAIQALRSEAYDVVVCDLDLPDSTGLETVSRIVAVDAGAPVLVLTGLDDLQVSSRCLAEGADDYICKIRVGAELNTLMYNARERSRLRAEFDLAQKNVQNLLRDSEDGALILDESNRVVFANPAAVSLFEGKLDLGDEFGFPIATEDSTIIDVGSRDGTVRHVDLRVRPTRCSDRDARVVNLRDITDRINDRNRIVRLNQVLRAIRKVNQLIVAEDDPANLIEKACALLIETRGYNGAWIGTGDYEAPNRIFSGAGWGNAFGGLARTLEQGSWPPCVDKALATPECHVVAGPETACGGCPLAGCFADSDAVITALRHESAVYGVLGVSFPRQMTFNREEQDLLLEVAGDIAFALHRIELEREKSGNEARLKQSQDRLREEKTRAQQYLNVAAVMLLGLDAEGRINLLNQRGCEVLGFPDEQSALGRDWFQFIPEETREEMCEVHRQNMANDAEPSLRVESKIRTLSGAERTMLWHNAAFRGKDGRIVGTLSSGEDVTEQRRLEAQLAQADRLSNMGMLAAGVAHEINNPLSYVLYNLESLGEDLPGVLGALRRFQFGLADKLGTDFLDELTGTDTEKLNPSMLDDMQSRLEDALGGTYRIRDVSRGLGTFSRVEKDQLVPVNLMHAIEVALNMAFNEIKYRARLVKDYGRNLPLVLGSEGRLGQVFLNLVINATHAIDEGDIENNEIRVRTWAEDALVFAQVRDTGSGIAPENLGKIFEPFFTTKKIGVGSGLGLAISKDIIESYGGSIEVESEVGTGTSFTIRLPVQAQEALSTEERPVETAPDATRGRILIVDDEDAIRRSMVRLLRQHETVQAASGAEAKKLLEHDQRFDLVLCDMMMPDVSGIDLHRWLAVEHPVLARQLIFITGGAFTPRAREYLSKVDNIRLEKPFDVANFKKIVGDRIFMARGMKSAGA